MAISESKSIGSRLFDIINIFLLLFLTLLFLYPVWHVLMASISHPMKLLLHRGALLLPTGFSLEGYKMVFRNSSIMIGYRNTIIYVVGGTFLNILLTSMGAYILSRRRLMFKNVMTILIVFTMYFGGGLIPDFLLVKNIGLYNSGWALILPGAISTWNLIVMRTSFRQISPSLEESAMLDGANDFIILFRIILPVAKATIAVMILFYAVGHWNSWFSAMVYLRDRDKYPLQLFLREILIANSTMGNGGASTSVDGMYSMEELIKNATIIISTIPILCIYPMAQKYFITGVMMGSLKE